MNRQSQKSNATKRRHRVQIQEKSETRDSENALDETWKTIDTVWASVDPIRAVQQFQGRSVGVDATHLVGMDARITISELNRLVFDNRNLEILVIENMQERDFDLVITCKEVR